MTFYKLILILSDTWWQIQDLTICNVTYGHVQVIRPTAGGMRLCVILIPAHTLSCGYPGEWRVLPWHFHPPPPPCVVAVKGESDPGPTLPLHLHSQSPQHGYDGYYSTRNKGYYKQTMVRFTARAGFLSSPSLWLWDPLTLLSIMSTGCSFLWGHKANHSPTSTAKVRDAHSITSLPSWWCQGTGTIIYTEPESHIACATVMPLDKKPQLQCNHDRMSTA